MGRAMFVRSNHMRTFLVFNQPPRPTQPGHPAGVGKSSTGLKTRKVTTGYERSVCGLSSEFLPTAGSGHPRSLCKFYRRGWVTELTARKAPISNNLGVKAANSCSHVNVNANNDVVSTHLMYVPTWKIQQITRFKHSI